MVWSYIDYDYPSDSFPFPPRRVSLVPYACVSRDWQLTFERLTFRKVVVRSSQVSRFKEYVVGHRMTSLHKLSFKIIIPNSDRFHSIGGIQRDNRAFTQSIKDLWALLKCIEDGCHMPQALKLRVRLSAQPSDPARRFPSNLLDFLNDRNLEEVDQPNRFAKISNQLPLKLMRIPEDLPPLHWVDGFSFVQTDRSIHSAALRRLASRFQDLTYFKLRLWEDSTQTRSDVAREISNLSLPRLSKLVFDFDPLFTGCHGNSKSSGSSDAISMALHGLLQSPNLVKATSKTRFTPELFWPRLEEFGGRQKPFWPCLQSITVRASEVYPDGTSLHIPEYMSARLDMSKVNPLLMAAARAAQHMPKLLEMKLKVIGHEDMDNPHCEMAFAAQDYCSEEDIKGNHAALRLDRFISLGSKKPVLLSDQLDLSKPRVSILMPSRCTVDSRLAQVWKTSKGEDVDYKVCYGFVRNAERDHDHDENEN